jgi:hypothetical protein
MQDPNLKLQNEANLLINLLRAERNSYSLDRDEYMACKIKQAHMLMSLDERMDELQKIDNIKRKKVFILESYHCHRSFLV